MSKSTTNNFQISLTEKEIAIIKSALQYAVLEADFEWAVYALSPAATFGSSDEVYNHLINNLYKKLNELTDIAPDFGGGCIDRISELLETEYKKLKKEQEEHAKKYGH